jgi:putative ABC transport system permease protein
MRPERLLHNLGLGLKSLAVHRLRSSLAILGIVLGVASVIVMLAVGEAARHEAVQQIKDLGITNIIIRSVKPVQDGKPGLPEGVIRYGLTGSDLDRIASTIPTVVSATPVRESQKEVRYLEHKLEGRVVSVTPNFLKVSGLKLSRGRFISDLDNQQFANVAVLAAETSETLFPFQDPIGRTVHIGERHCYLVVGITERRTPSAGAGPGMARQDYNRDVYIPFTTDRARFGAVVTYERAGVSQAERLEISHITVTVDRQEHVRKTSAAIRSLLGQFHVQEDTAVIVPLDLLEKAENTQRIFTLVLGAIASISLVVGGIGVMNIMLAVVTERTREIGIRRALGAKRRDITWQFLVEAVMLSGAGGLLGVGLGIALSHLVTHLSAFPTIIRLWSLLLAFAVSVAVGLLFGTYPARQAACLDPIEALRHE